MRFGFMSEGQTPVGTTIEHRWREVVEEVIVADAAGWDLFGTSEQHLAIGAATVSEPATLYSYLMPLTKRIRFMHAITPLPRSVNHPIRVAERIACEDILSGGRMELGTGRGNTQLMLGGFEVSPEENKAQWDEGLEVIRSAWLDDPFSFRGKHFNIPPRSLVPKPIQRPHPPLWMAATSPASHVQAAEKGIGVISFSNFLGLEFSAHSLKLYDEAFDAANHTRPAMHGKGYNIAGLAYCHEDARVARDTARPLIEIAKLLVGGYERLSKMSADYAYMGAVKDIAFDDEDFMLDDSGGFLVGDPDEVTAQVRRLEGLGVDTLLLRIDGIPHLKVIECLETFGKYVIPRVNTPEQLVRSADDVLAGIRQARTSNNAPA